MFYPMLFAAGISNFGCTDKADDPQVSIPTPPKQPPVLMNIDANLAKVGPTSRVRFSVSRKPKPYRAGLFESTDQFIFFELGFNRILDTAPKSIQSSGSWDQANIHADSLYLTLYYVDTNSQAFVKPTAADEVTVQVKIDGQSPITLRVNQNTCQDSTNSWINNNGFLNSGVQKVIAI